jgi:hypothetical protein
MLSEKEPTKVLTIIHDKMDHSKTASLLFSYENKATDPLMKLPVAVTGMIAHGHGNVQYAHYGLDIYPSDSNHTVGSIAKLLRDLESLLVYSTRQLFAEGGSSPLFQALLTRADMCEASLPPVVADPIMAAPLPPVLNVQLDNACSDNKNRYVFSFFSLLVQKGVFREVYVNFLLVRHTHEDIDAMFGRWSYRLRANDYPTLPMLMKSFMDAEKQPVILHLIEEVPNFKAFVDGFLYTGTDALEGHTNAQQFKFYKDGNGWPMMQYKLFCTDSEWLPRENGSIRLWQETADGRPKVPSSSPVPLVPHKMRNFDEVAKGLGGFVNLWDTMANEDISGEFRRQNEPLSYYWRAVTSAMDAAISVPQTLQNGFWPSSRFAPTVEDEYMDDDTVREEYAEDALFVGRRRDRPPPSFRVGRDVYAGYFLAVRSTDGDLRPFWVARVVSNPNPDPGHRDQIQIQYWRPNSFQHVDADTYAGWDSKEGNVWYEDNGFLPSWSHIDCVMTAWKSRVHSGTDEPKMKIPTK